MSGGGHLTCLIHEFPLEPKIRRKIDENTTPVSNSDHGSAQQSQPQEIPLYSRGEPPHFLHLNPPPLSTHLPSPIIKARPITGARAASLEAAPPSRWPLPKWRLPQKRAVPGLKALYKARSSVFRPRPQDAAFLRDGGDPPPKVELARADTLENLNRHLKAARNAGFSRSAAAAPHAHRPRLEDATRRHQRVHIHKHTQPRGA